MKRYSDQFLSDLAHLVSHGSGPLDRLVDDLSDPDRRRDIIEALSQLSKLAAERSHASGLRATAASPFSYEDIRTPNVTATNPKSGEMLDSIKEKLTTAGSLRKRRVLADLAYDLGVPVTKKDSMPRIVQNLLDSLATRKADDIAMALRRISEADRGSTESYMDLASFITRAPRTGTRSS